MGHIWGFGVHDRQWGRCSLFLLMGEQHPAQGHAQVLIPGDSEETLLFGECSASGAQRLGTEEELKDIPGECPSERSPVPARWLLFFPIFTNNIPSFEHDPFPEASAEAHDGFAPSQRESIAAVFSSPSSTGGCGRLGPVSRGTARAVQLLPHSSGMETSFRSRSLLRSFCKPFLSSSLKKPSTKASCWVHDDPDALLCSIFGVPEQATAIFGAEGRLCNSLKYFL